MFNPVLLAVGALLMVLPPNLDLAQNGVSGNQITVCLPKLTKLGRSARFQGNFIYRVEVESDGSVSKVTRLLKDSLSNLIEEDALIECIETWKLSPPGDYSVCVTAGTDAGPHVISISTEAWKHPFRLKLN